MKGEWYQGTFVPTHPSKCINKDTIKFRSSYESRFLHWLDDHPDVQKWGYEILEIPYIYEIDGKQHRYITDFYAEIKDKHGNINKYIIEIKPKHQTEKPVLPKKKSQKSMKNYIYEAQQFVKNQNKWNAAKLYCDRNNMTFKLINENTLF